MDLKKERNQVQGGGGLQSDPRISTSWVGRPTQRHVPCRCFGVPQKKRTSWIAPTVYLFLWLILYSFFQHVGLRVDLCTNDSTQHTTLYDSLLYCAPPSCSLITLLPTHPTRPQKTSLCGGTVSACSLPWLTCTSKQRTATRLVRRLVSTLVRRLVSGLVSRLEHLLVGAAHGDEGPLLR